MSRLVSRPNIVRKLDPVWDRLRTEAEDIARNEPALGSFVYSVVLSHASFEEALMHRLAQRMGGADLGSDAIATAFGDAMKLEPEIGFSARADIIATHDRDPACTRYIEPLLYFKGWQALQIHRMAHVLCKNGRKDMAFFLQSRSSSLHAIDINPHARIGKGILIDHGHDIVIGETCVIEDNVSILQGVTLGGTGKEVGDRHPKIRQGVLIGAGAKVLGNIEVGKCSRIAAGSVVLQAVPPNVTVAGVPARIVGKAGCAEPSRVMDQLVEEEEG